MVSRAVLAVAVAVAALYCVASVKAQSDLPNFLVFLADDVGWNDLGTTGAIAHKTPVLDKLAYEGVKFTQWYAGAALCTPSRGALLTGRLPIRLGLYTRLEYPGDLLLRVFYPSSVGSLPANETTIATALREKGYFSALVGKWHLGHVNALPTERGFDYFYGTPYSHDEGYPGPFPISFVWPPVPVYEGTKIVEQPINMDTITDRMTEKALAVIDANVNLSRPFFLEVAYHEAHIPAFATGEFAGSSRAGPYGDMVQQMDASIGKIIDHLRLRGIERNTLVIFTSDNGAWPNAKEPGTKDEGHQGDGGSNAPFYEGKASTWEGGLREPTIAWWPGVIPGGRVLQDIASHMDLLPTILEFAGIAPPSDRILDGKSLASLLKGTVSEGPNQEYFYWRESQLVAVRVGRHKGHFITRPGWGNVPPVVHDPMLLFDLERDPGEQYPLNATAYPVVVRSIQRARESHLATIQYAASQFDTGGTFLGQDWKVVPCCSRQSLQREFDAPDPPADWPLRLWKNCICPTGNVTMTTTTTMPPVWMGTFMGEPIAQFEKIMSAAQQYIL